MDIEPFGYTGQTPEEMRDALHLRVDRERFAQKNVRTFEGATILSVGGRDERLGNDHVFDVRLANGQRLPATLDQNRHQDSAQAIDRIYGKTNVFREDKNTPLPATLEGTFTQVKRAATGQPEWVLRLAQASVVLPDGTALQVGRPVHPATHDIQTHQDRPPSRPLPPPSRRGGFEIG
jgi:hypothetical protein